MSQSPKDTVASFFSALRAQGAEAALEFVSEDANFIAVLGDDAKERFSFYGNYRGHAGVRQFLKNLADSYDTQEFTVYKTLGDEEHAVMWGHFKHVIKATGHLFESDWALICAVSDGKITQYQFYEDTAALEQCFDLPARPKLG